MEFPKRWVSLAAATMIYALTAVSAWGAEQVGFDEPAVGYTVGPVVDVLIDAGHGGIDGGTSYGEILEKDLNLAVALKLYELLRARDVSVALNRTSDYALSDDNKWQPVPSRHLRDLAQRKLLIDSLKPKLTVSIHVNWANSIARHGPSVLYQKSEASKAAARVLIKHLNALYGTNETPVRGKSFYLLNRAKTTTVIVEIGYISHPGDRALLISSSGQTKIAEALASAIQQYLAAQ